MPGIERSNSAAERGALAAIWSALMLLVETDASSRLRPLATPVTIISGDWSVFAESVGAGVATAADEAVGATCASASPAIAKAANEVDSIKLRVARNVIWFLPRIDLFLYLWCPYFRHCKRLQEPFCNRLHNASCCALRTVNVPREG